MTTIYSKDSFNRFDDKLCEDILSYFPLKDGIKYECVSKQWKRTVYKSVDRLLIRSSNGNISLTKLFTKQQLERGVPALVSLLKKCQNLRYIYIDYILHRLQRHGIHRDMTDTIFSVIEKYCRNLKSMDNSSVCLSRTWFVIPSTFMEDIGPQLETIYLKDSSKYFGKLNEDRYPSLRRLAIYSLNKESDVLGFTITRLTHLKVNYFWTEEEFLRKIIRSNKQLRRLDIICSINQIISEELLTEMSDLTLLESLDIRLSTDQNLDTILDKLKIIGQKCHQMKKLSINDQNCKNRFRFVMCLSILKFYPNLVSFELIFYERSSEESFQSCELLAKCSNLRNLILNVYELKDSFFEDIHKYVPKLRHLSIHNSNISEAIVDYIEKLPELQALVLGRAEVSNYSMSNTEIIQPGLFYKLFRNCSRMKSVYLTHSRNKYLIYRNYSDGITKFCQCPETWFEFDQAI